MNYCCILEAFAYLYKEYRPGAVRKFFFSFFGPNWTRRRRVERLTDERMKIDMEMKQKPNQV